MSAFSSDSYQIFLYPCRTDNRGDTVFCRFSVFTQLYVRGEFEAKYPIPGTPSSNIRAEDRLLERLDEETLNNYTRSYGDCSLDHAVQARLTYGRREAKTSFGFKAAIWQSIMETDVEANEGYVWNQEWGPYGSPIPNSGPFNYLVGCWCLPGVNCNAAPPADDNTPLPLPSSPSSSVVLSSNTRCVAVRNQAACTSERSCVWSSSGSCCQAQGTDGFCTSSDGTGRYNARVSMVIDGHTATTLTFQRQILLARAVADTLGLSSTRVTVVSVSDPADDADDIIRIVEAKTSVTIVFAFIFLGSQHLSPCGNQSIGGGRRLTQTPARVAVDMEVIGFNTQSETREAVSSLDAAAVSGSLVDAARRQGLDTTGMDVLAEEAEVVANQIRIGGGGGGGGG
eukprot:5393962-Pyramimonas_sp.AAC.1